jgi:catalase
VRTRVLGHLANIDGELLQRVEAGLGMEGQADSIAPARQPIDMKPSPALSLIKKAPKTLKGRKVGVLVSDGSDPAVVAALKSALAGVGARMEVVAPKIGGAKGLGGKVIPADHKIDGGPSILFDAVVVAVSAEGAAMLAANPAAIDWVRDAFAHLKVMGVTDGAMGLLDAAGITPDDGVIMIKGKAVGAFIESAMEGRVWERENPE